MPLQLTEGLRLKVVAVEQLSHQLKKDSISMSRLFDSYMEPHIAKNE